jgi:hypothetical protein
MWLWFIDDEILAHHLVGKTLPIVPVASDGSVIVDFYYRY